MLCHKKYVVTKNATYTYFMMIKIYRYIIQMKYSNFIQIMSIEYFCCRNNDYVVCKKKFQRDKNF